mmetsp:Transcript_87118/g.243117  ORF Transcript_87118/g.243117 Transcript_87118/m.243117 type:complete len:170 (+) Transcript_87118:114-623(+)
MEFWQAAQWTLRIVLPIILFILWSKFQSGNEGPSGYPGPTKNVCSRGKILSRRKLVDPEDKPQTLANLCMKSQEQAPELFVNGSRPGRGGGGGGRRGLGRARRGDVERGLEGTVARGHRGRGDVDRGLEGAVARGRRGRRGVERGMVGLHIVREAGQHRPRVLDQLAVL